MSTELALQESALVDVLSGSLYPGAKKESIMMVLGYCRAAGLDPMQKPVHIVPMWDGRQGAMRDVVMPGISLYRINASRSGSYGGMSEPEFGDDITAVIGGSTITYPVSCRVTVSRIVGDKIVNFTAREFWLENYAVKGGKEKSIAPNSMWQKRPYAQLAKCAEAQALRKAFPESCIGNTAEEMEGKQLNEAPEKAQGPAVVLISDEQVLALETAICGAGIGDVAFCEKARVSKIADLEAARYEAATKWVNSCIKEVPQTATDEWLADYDKAAS